MYIGELNSTPEALNMNLPLKFFFYVICYVNPEPPNMYIPISISTYLTTYLGLTRQILEKASKDAKLSARAARRPSLHMYIYIYIYI